MRQQIRKFSVGQTAKTVAVVYGVLGLVIVPFLLIGSILSPKDAGIGVGFALLIPILYAVVGFIGTALACAIYNLVANWVGGIEVELETASGPVTY
jgi:hypothetical protein